MRFFFDHAIVDEGIVGARTAPALLAREIVEVDLPLVCMLDDTTTMHDSAEVFGYRRALYRAPINRRLPAA